MDGGEGVDILEESDDGTLTDVGTDPDEGLFIVIGDGVIVLEGLDPFDEDEDALGEEEAEMSTI